MITVEDLYNHFNILNNAKEDILQYEDSYLSILSGLKGGNNEKRLASQFVARFFKHFPNHAEQGIESVFDLCEDADSNVRKQAIKDLPLICKAYPSYCKKVSDILTQLLHGSDTVEMNLTQMSLMSLLRVDAKATLAGIFEQIIQGNEAVRGKAISFLGAKMKVIISEDLLSKDGGEEYFVNQCKEVLTDVTGDEFLSFMKILSVIPSMSSLQGRSQLLEIITDQADLTKPFDMSDEISASEHLSCLIQCMKQAIHLFSKNVHSNQYVEHICLKVLPFINETNLDVHHELVRLLSEIVMFSGPLKSVEDCVINVYEDLLNFVPLPPSDSGEAELLDSSPKLQFSLVECLMFTFHQLARNTPHFLSDPENAERLKDFRSRLQYFGRGVQAYMKSLKNVAGGSNTENVSEEVSLALKTTVNINILIKDLFHNPPSYRAAVNLSFKKPSEVAIVGQKRQPTETLGGSEDQTKKSKTDQAIYVPPGRKNVQKTGSYAAPQAARGRNGNFRRY